MCARFKGNVQALQRFTRELLRDVVSVVLSAAPGICLAYALERYAIRRTSARMVGILGSTAAPATT